MIYAGKVGELVLPRTSCLYKSSNYALLSFCRLKNLLLCALNSWVVPSILCCVFICSDKLQSLYISNTSCMNLCVRD
jgi:hypothetical protein